MLRNSMSTIIGSVAQLALSKDSEINLVISENVSIYIHGKFPTV